MSWLRRFLALSLALLFIPLFTIMLLVSRVNGTFFNSHFYVEQLRKADIYNFLYDEFLPATLEEVELSVDITPFKAEAVPIAKEVLPPQWLQTQVEKTITSILPYMFGDTDSFTITIPVKERLDALETVTADILKRPATYEYFLQAITKMTAEEGMQLDRLPAGITVTEEEVLRAIKEALPLEWYQSVVTEIVSQVFSYLKGKQEKLEVVLPLEDRKSAIAASLTELAGKKVESYINSLPTCRPTQLEEMVFTTGLKDLPTCLPPGFSYTRQGERGEIFLLRIDLSQQTETLTAIVANMVKKPENYERFLARISETISGEGVIQLPIGLTLTADEVMPALREAFSLTWYQSLATDIARQVIFYLTDSQETLEVTVPVAENKLALATSLTELADRKLERYVESLPLCTPEELTEMLTNPPRGRLPTCRPPGYSYSQFKDLLGIDIGAQITLLINTKIPDQWSFTQADLTQIFGGKNLLAQAKERVKKGLTFSIDISIYIAPAVATIPDRWMLTQAELGLPDDFLTKARQHITQGFTFTQDDLIKRLDPEGQRSLDKFRHGIKQVRKWLFLGWAFLIILLGAIGMLGGRRLWSKIAWAMVVLAIASAIVYILSGPVYSGVVRPQIEAALSQMVAGAQGAELVLMNKAITLVQNGVNTFVLGLSHQANLLLALAGLGGAIFWKQHQSRRQKP